MDGVEQTNEDATLCKKSAVRFGYWRDPYIDQLAPKNVERKAPEIHLGYYTRVVGLKRLVDKAMEVMADKCDKGVQVLLLIVTDNSIFVPHVSMILQIINFGAGFDTLYWRLKDDLESSGRQDRLKNFVEVDFPGVTARKCHAVKRSKSLLEKVAGEDGEVRLSKTDLHGYDYHIVAADMTNAAKLEAKLEECGVDFSAPTIFVAECVLVYISPKTTQEFLTWLTKRFSRNAPLAFVDHEQVNLRDRFGQVMLENLSARGCGLAGAESCKDKETQAARFLSSGWDGARCWTMSEAYSMLPGEEVDRVERLELFDERELMQQLFDHYCLTVAWREREKEAEFPQDDSWLWTPQSSTTTTT